MNHSMVKQLRTMVLCMVTRLLLKARRSAYCARLLHTQSVCVYGSAQGFKQEEIVEKLRAFPGGSVDLVLKESGTMMLELEERVTQLEGWMEGKGVIVQGAAGTFCSGSDLNAVKAISNPQDGMKMCMFMQNTLTRLLRLPMMSVALVEGRALGGGSELTTACDFRLMAPGSRIQFVHKHMGLVPGWGGAARLVRIVGSQNSLRLLGGAMKVDPELALQMGLADGVLGAQPGNYNTRNGTSALLEAEKWLEFYVKGPVPVIRAVKQVVMSGRELSLQEALRTEKDVFGTVWGGPANRAALASKAKHK
ncbi:ethylmalonyl-CoA decarboxylase isoform X4 [Hypomesus transpacificus]|uniref:ethylmalonyl-CoA decarboxylase isoform X4 n=1 Tax=Hypomesus transpacificus TaxID=137520 RepID=UPI001F07CD33|nr:ethylmalonyl-CoA decarboxylase isoform X4 [Hypomesus transpacificus]